MRTDVSSDVEQSIDKIDLADIDANSFLDGNQVFDYIEDAAFTGNGSGSVGQLRAFNVSGNIWQVEGDVNGDGVADMVIQVETSGPLPLTGGDFLL